MLELYSGMPGGNTRHPALTKGGRLMIRTGIALALAWISSTPMATRNDELHLAANGKALCTIVVAGAEPERHAAEELAHFLGEISGARFEVEPLGKHGSGSRILVGREAASAMISAAEFGTLGGEGYLIRARGSELAIAGAKPRGTLYGVYSFLEDRMGCRWFTPDVARIPKNASPSASI